MLQQVGRQLMLLQHLGYSSSTQASAATLRLFASGAASHTALIKQLREKSGAPISDVKACLEANGWDMDKAYDALRKKGLAAAAKKASRHAAEGLVALAEDGQGAAAIVEVNSETDFVARNELFQRMARQVASAVLSLQPSDAATGALDLEQLLQTRSGPGGPTVSDLSAEVAAQVRENVRVRRGFKLATTGVLSTYLHQSAGPGLGRIASAVALEAADGKPLDGAARAQAAELGQQLAMHVAGMRPRYLSRDSVPQEVLEHERALLRAQAAPSGKPPAVVDKMVEGRLKKYYEEAVLAEQRFFLDDTLTVAGVVDKLSKVLGRKLQLRTFLRVQCGEGLDAGAGKTDFATEVQAMVQGK